MRNRRLQKPAPLLALATISALASSAWAQQPVPDAGTSPDQLPIITAPAAAAAARGGSAQTAGITLKLMDMLITVRPSVEFQVTHDDNIYLSQNNRVSDQILILTPALRLETRQANNAYSLRLSTTLGQYQRNSADNYTNYNVNGSADLNPSTNVRVHLIMDYLDGEDPRGSTNNPLSTTPDRYRQVQGRGIFSYGGRDAKARIDVELGEVRRNYYNNRAVTEGNDRTVDDIGATFFWRVGPKTTLLFQGKHSIIDYSLQSSTQGSVENALLAGATWEATAKTKATFKIGRVAKDFDDASRSKSKTTSWSGELRWSPLTYSHVDVNLTRTPAETTGGFGDFIDRSSTGARWSHEWSNRFVTEASASYLTEAYQGAARNDNTRTLGIKATYKMRLWLNFGGEITHAMRHSDNSGFDYRRNALMLFVKATL